MSSRQTKTLDMVPQLHVFQVEMSCGGCSNAVQKVLEKHKEGGIDDIKIDLGSQRVVVTSSLAPEEILNIIKKTGKNTQYLGLEVEPAKE